MIFFILATGNTITTSHVVYQKFREKLSENIKKFEGLTSTSDSGSTSTESKDNWISCIRLVQIE